MSQLILIAHNLRSTHNVGSLLRTAEGLGLDCVWLTGYTPFPSTTGDTRLPHLAQKIDKQIAKTALGAETSQHWQQADDVLSVIRALRQQGYTIAALEQTTSSIALPTYQPANKLAIVVGREVEGVEAEVLAACDLRLEIPMFGHKESFNVVQAAAMCLYHCRFAA